MQYICLINDINEGNISTKKLASLTKTDNLRVLYFAGEDMISLKVYDEISKIPAKTSFEEVAAANIENNDVALAFHIGRLTATTGCKSLSGNNLINTLCQQGENTPVKKTRKKRSDTVTETTAEKTESKKNLEKLDKTMPKPEEPDEFDKQFDKLSSLLGSVKTKTFDPASYLQTIVKAAKCSDKEKAAFDDILPLYCSPNTAEQLLLAIMPIRTEVIELAIAIKDN